MAPPVIDEAFVRRSSALHGIELTPEQVPGVVANFQLTARIAAAVNEFPLDQVTDESGPVWRP